MKLFLILLSLQLWGNVDASSPETAPLGCGTPSPLPDGDTKETLRNRYRHGERVEYICQSFYIMEGGPFKTCDHGGWIGHIRCLKPCTVDQEAMDPNNIEFLHTDKPKVYLTHNDVISFKCKGRRRQYGTVGMRQWCNDGVIHLPSCT